MFIMIIKKKVKVYKAGNRNLSYYKDLGYDINNGLKFIEVDVDHLTPGSKTIVESECDFCKTIVGIKYNLYLKNISSNGLFACSPKCGKNKSVMTILKEFGVEYINQVDEIKKKKKETSLINWGVDNPSKSDIIKERIITTNIDKLGVKWTFQSEEVKKKSKETLISRFGVDHCFKSPEVREKSKETLLNRWGVDNPSKSEEVKNKKRETSLINWGVDHPLKSEFIRKKVINTNLQRFGVEWPMMNNEVKSKSISTFKINWGVDWNSKSAIIKNSMKINNLNKWGVEFTLQSPEIRDKIKLTTELNWGSQSVFTSDIWRKKNLKIANDSRYIKYIGNDISLFNCDLGHDFQISSDNWHSRINGGYSICTVCYPIGNSISISEKDLYNYISHIYSGEVIQSYRDVLEIDIYLPDLKLGFEFNGLYWHSDKYKKKNYHLEKTKHFKDRGIRLIHIWEDDWDLRSDIIKSQIKNWLGLTESRIFARKCKVSVLDSVSDFLGKNHIQGVDHSSLKLGLFNDGELVSVMTFNWFEGRKKMESGGWNLSRFCNLLNTSIIGGASKILKYFINNYNPTRIVSYADRDWSCGDLYLKLGFNLVSESRPDYKYLVSGIRVHKSNFKKSKLGYKIKETEYVQSLGYSKIWDCGKLKYEIHY